MWKKLLGIIRKLLNAANTAGYIPSQDHGIPTNTSDKPHDPTFPDVK